MSEVHLPPGARRIDEPLPGYRVETRDATATVLFHGAQLTEWTPQGEQPVIWMSGSSRFAPDQAIRGGIPICFPWFGPGRSGDLTPGHGWARLVDWRPESVVETADGIEITLVIDHTDVARRQLVDTVAEFTLRARHTIGRSLQTVLQLTAGAFDVDCEAALHTYFAVADIATTTVEGLDGVPYLDKVSGARESQNGSVVFAAETDRVYDCATPTSIVTAERTIEIAPRGSTKTVVWNPWVGKAAAMPDYGDDEWQAMVCVEAAACGDAPWLVPAGTTSEVGLTISVARH